MNWDIRGRAHDKVANRTASWTFTLAPLAKGLLFRDKGYRGRPALTARIKDGFEEFCACSGRSTAIRERANLSHFWRFLDDQEHLSRALDNSIDVRIDDISWDELEVVWRHFINWLRSQPASQMSPRTRYYANYTVHAVFRRAFDLAVARGETEKPSLDIYVYFRQRNGDSYKSEHVEFDDAKWAFRQLAQMWRKVLKRIEKGRALAASSEGYVLGSSGAHRWNGGVWPHIQNRLAYMFSELPFGGLNGDRTQTARTNSDRLSYELPAELQLAELGYETSGVDAHLGCLFLRNDEIAIALAMVTMKTGMNVDAITRMQVDDWCRPDPLQPEKRVILYGRKRVGDKNIRASSSKAKLTDAYQIMTKIIEIQAPLRKHMADMALLRGDKKLAEQAKLVWLYAGRRGISDTLPGRCRNELHARLDAFFEARSAEEARPEFRYRFSDGRDVWSLFVYHRSGFNHILTMQALGHSTLRSLLHYLEKRVVLVEDRKRLIDLQGRVLVDLQRGEYVPARHRSERAELASTGLRCTDPQYPDVDADPGNPGGRICAAQRCFACSKWYATYESLAPLSRIILDLQELRGEMALAVWETSDFPMMLAIYEHIRGKFHPSLVEPALQRARTMPRIVRAAMFVGPEKKVTA